MPNTGALTVLVLKKLYFPAHVYSIVIRTIFKLDFVEMFTGSSVHGYITTNSDFHHIIVFLHAMIFNF